jgi:hypothetical protein
VVPAQNEATLEYSAWSFFNLPLDYQAVPFKILFNITTVKPSDKLIHISFMIEREGFTLDLCRNPNSARVVARNLSPTGKNMR